MTKNGSLAGGSTGAGSPAGRLPANGSAVIGSLGDGARANGSPVSGSSPAGSAAGDSPANGTLANALPGTDALGGGSPAIASPGGDSLAVMVERLALALERSNVLDYAMLLQRPWRLLWINFVGGMARGLGIGIGFTVLTAILLYALHGLMLANLPVIGDLIATIVRLVEQQLRP